MRCPPLIAATIVIPLLVSLGCSGEEIIDPFPTGSLEIITSTSGDSPDPGSYQVLVDEREPIAIGPSDTTALNGLAAGDHLVRLVGVAANCSAAEGFGQTVTVSDRAVAVARFTLTCVPAGPPAEMIAYHSSRDGEYDVFTVRLDGSAPVNITAGLLNHRGGGYTYPKWSPDGGRIAFSGGLQHHLYVINADGSELKDLTPHTGVHLGAAWSPDGRSLVTSGAGVALVNADGSGERFLTEGGCAVWSPDGSRIAFGRGNGIFTIRPDGSGETRLTQAAPDELDCEPKWSPDGTRIAFVRRDAEDLDGWFLSNLWVVNADGGNPRQLTNYRFRSSGSTAGHAWSPDGSRLALSGYVPGGRDILLLDPNGGEPINLTQDNRWDEISPVWSPDGRRILFAAEPLDVETLIGGPPEVFVMDSDGGNRRNLTNYPSYDFGGAWQP